MQEEMRQRTREAPIVPGKNTHAVSQVDCCKAATCFWGVLSGILLRGRESRPHGEGPDGSTQSIKETRAGHVGLDKHEPTTLRGIATGSCNGQL